MQSLKRLFNPESIAVVGASADEAKAGYQIVYALREFPGEIYPINPKADTILGFKVFPNLKAIGRQVDLVVFAIPAANCINILKEAGEVGAGSALIVSGGFAETGEAGQKIQQEILSVSRKYNIRILGPNTAGYANPAARLFANFTPWITGMPAGNIAVISQSGSMALTLSALIRTQNLGISLAAGIGNGVDVNIADTVEYLEDDPQTKVIVLYLEGISYGRRLYDVIRKTMKKKPIIVLTIGKADIADFAVSHTGNLIGSYKIKKAALKQAGAVVFDSSNDLIDAAHLFSRTRLSPKENPGVGLLTGQAGAGLVIADYLKSNGVLIPVLMPLTIEKIKKELPPISFIRNPVDTTRPGSTFPNVLNAMKDDPSIDILAVFAIHEPVIIDPVAIFKESKDIKQPLIFGTAGFPEHIHPTQKALAELNIASYASPDRTARAIRALVDDAKASFRRANQTEMPLMMKDFAQFKKAPNEAETKKILKKIGIPAPKMTLCKTYEEAKKAFKKLKKPCVVKVVDPAISHKTEAGGVLLGIKTEKQLKDALKKIDNIDTGNKKQYIIEEMAKSGLEIIIGAVNDDSFGPTVLLGLGGTTAEALEDVAMRLAPLAVSDAMEMIDELKGKSLFNGWRGSPAVDKQKIAEAIVKIGQLMMNHPEIKEMDLNPVRVYAKGLLALDALIVLR
jgi:acetate---CoA ligase (ADP-forming)